MFKGLLKKNTVKNVIIFPKLTRTNYSLHNEEQKDFYFFSLIQVKSHTVLINSDQRNVALEKVLVPPPNLLNLLQVVLNNIFEEGNNCFHT